MPNAIKFMKCPKCGEKIEINKILSHQIEEEVLASSAEKHKQELIEVKKQAELQAWQKLSRDFDLQIKTLQKERDEEKERNTKLLKQLEGLTDEVRKMRRKDEERELEMKKRLFEEESRIKEEVGRKFLEEHEMKDKEKDKKMVDLVNQIELWKAKAQQGSQQTQGEVLELELEGLLKKEFPDDEIKEIKKGQRGADIIQQVIDKRNAKCGTILWESKNAQWSDSWLAKLKEDQREAKAELAVLVVVNPPNNIKDFTYTYKNGVWITTKTLIVALAFSLRFDLIHIHHEKMTNIGKNEKMAVLYQYLTGIEFKHRIEAIVEAFSNLQVDIEKEKRWFQTKWARQEKELRKIIDHTQGMYGDLQGVTGRSLPEIKSLQLESGEKEN